VSSVLTSGAALLISGHVQQDMIRGGTEVRTSPDHHRLNPIAVVQEKFANSASRVVSEPSSLSVNCFLSVHRGGAHGEKHDLGLGGIPHSRRG
jgi:hypothetical protein